MLTTDEYILGPKQKHRIETCGRCGANKTFKFVRLVENETPQSFFAQCRNCGLQCQCFLPKLSKRILYLDQFALSNLALASYPELKPDSTVPQFWFELLSTLNKLLRKQLIVCPDSLYQWKESQATPLYNQIKETFQYFNWDVSFREPGYIKESQIADHALLWLRKGGRREPRLKMFDAIHGNLNHWAPRWRYPNRMQPDFQPDHVQIELQRRREDLAKVHEGWRAEAQKTYTEWFKEHIAAFGHRTLQGSYPLARRFIRAIQNTFEGSGIPCSTVNMKVSHYLQSDCLECIPFLKLSAHLLAARARNAVRSGPPNPGTATDFDLLATLLPYCDAMLIDRPTLGLLQQRPRLFDCYGTRVYSYRTRQEFLGYLTDLEVAADQWKGFCSQFLYNWEGQFRLREVR